MGQRRTGKQAGRKKAGKKQRTATRQAAPRKRSMAKGDSRRKSPASARKGAWSQARAEQHRLKREAILRVASRLINRKGYAGMSLADIAGELDIRNASLYYYFDSKEDLVFACYERAQRIVAETLESVEKSGGSGLEAIERYVVAMRKRMWEQGELPIAERVSSLSPAHMDAIIAAEFEHGRHVASLVERGIEDGSIRPCNVPLTTTMLIAALRAVPGHYLRVDEGEWPDLDKAVVGEVHQFLAAPGTGHEH